MKRIAVLAIVALTGIGSAVACSCAWQRPFIPIARGSLVIDGVVRRYVSLSRHRAPHPVVMEVEVRRVLRGRYTATAIRIIGDFGMSCVPYVTAFPLGTEWVFAVNGPASIPQLGDENFSFTPCARSWAEVRKGQAAIDGSTEMTLDDLARALDDTGKR